MGHVVKLKAHKDETVIVRVRMSRALKLALDAAARQNRRAPAIEAQARLAQTFRDDAMKVHLRDVNKLLGVHLDGIRDGLLAQSHAVTAVTQESMLTRQRLDEAMRLIAAAFTATESAGIADQTSRRRR